MKCPICGAAELIHDTRDLSHTYKGETTIIPAVTADFCPACGESITDMAETTRVMREMNTFTKQVNAIKEMNIDAVAKAIENDAGEALPELRQALKEAKALANTLVKK